MRKSGPFMIAGKAAISVQISDDGRIRIYQYPEPDCEYSTVYIDFEDAYAIGQELIRLSKLGA